MSTPIVILASGSGTNFEAIVQAVRDGKLAADVRALVCDRPGAPALERAARLGVPSVVIPFERGADAEAARLAHDERILSALARFQPRFLVLAGYMRILSARLIDAFRSERGYAKIVNIHPSLLPAFPGAGGYAQAYRYGAQIAGVSVHLVEREVDRGPICAQEAFAMGACSSEAEVEELGKKIEHRLYPRTLAWVLPERFRVIPRDSDPRDAPERRLCVRPD